MASHWEEQAIQLLKADQYDQLLKWCDRAIADQEQGSLPYWYLGLAYLLQQQADEAQAVWLSGWFEAPGQESSEQRTQQLANILEQEAQRQATKEAFAISAEIREQLQEIQPENINNSLQLIKLLINHKTFSSELLQEWDFIPRLEAAQEVDEELLREVISLLISEVPSVNRASLINTAFEKVKDKTKFLELIVKSGIKIGYSYLRKDIAVEILELCDQLNPNLRITLKYLTQLYSDAGKYQESTKTGERLIQNSETLIQKTEANCLYLRSLLSAGSWAEVPQIIPDYKNQLKQLAQFPLDAIPKDQATDMLQLAPLYLNYVEDNPEKTRPLQNATSKIFQFTAKKTELNSYLPSHSNKKYLKIGYFGYSLRYHSVGWLSRWLISNHNRNKFHVTVYLVDSKPDDLTKQLAKSVDHFRQLDQYTWENAQRIADDEIDILVDVDSCTFTKNCTILSYKPAPIQVTWLGWDASGLPAIDYYLADPYVLPEDAQDYYQETILRLPNSYVAVGGFEADIPTLAREDLDIPPDAIIYFSSQTALKRHPDTVHLQMKILKGVPNSYLLIKGRSDQELLENFFNDIAKEEGVDPKRLRFLDRDPSEYVHRANLSIADVVLDTYPYNGATTTLETLWMGIPLVTRVGEQYVARNSYTFLKNAGVEEGIAWTDEDYVEWGIKFGTDKNLRRTVHWKLLQSRKTSPLWDVEQFVNDVETAYEQMWEKYVEDMKTYPVAEEVTAPQAEKPTLRLLHNLPRCGGTLISKCLATMENNLLLSEIHPRGMDIMYNPLQQAHDWFNLLSIEDLNEFATTKPISFLDVIHRIHKRSQEQNYHLIIRDWAHLDFLGVPWTNNLSYRLDLAEALKPDFKLIQVAIVRHPLDQWLGLSRWSNIREKLTLEHFLKGYLEFAKIVSQMNFIRYEDFTQNPDAELKKICKTLSLTFDENYTSKWKEYQKITGDINLQKNEMITQEEEKIAPRPRRTVELETLTTIESSDFYQEAITLLGYDRVT